MIFEVTPAHIQALNDVDLRTLIGHLAEREVVAAGHSAAAVTYGGHQLAKDGGIDVRVALASGRIKGFVPRLSTGYQAKAEDFSAAAIKSEMRPKGELRESIRDLGRSGGAYIIVSSKGSVSDSSLENRRKAMAEAIANEPDAKPIFLDFYDKRRLATWTNQHPGIIPWVRERVGQPLSGWRPFQDWSSSPENEDGQYLLDEGVRLVDPHQTGDGLTAEEGINRLRSILSEPKGVVRLVGLSGVGKTRLVQALFDDRVGAAPLDRHLAVYTDMGDNPDPVPGELLSRLQSNGQRCIFIVDNCGIELHRNLATRLSASNLISLITVEYDISDDDVENTDVFMLEPASKDVIERILNLRHPTLTNPEIRTIADFSEGNFRIALALANTSRSGQSLANLRDSELFNRLFRQKNEDDPALLRGAKICSLVYSFDVETSEGDKTELPLLAALAGQSVSEFHGHVAELKRRQLVQVRARWRALLPHALAHRLANLALEDLPPGDIQTFVEAEAEAGSRRGLFGHFRESRPCPLRKIADDELLGWALERPETRFPALAASVLGWTGTKSDLIRDIAPEDEDETRGLKWTPTALRLIHEAPNPVVVLKEFEENFRPSSWSGSLAEILSRREALILALADDPDQRIRDWVQAAIPKLRDEVEATRKWEADNDRERHERFDW